MICPDMQEQEQQIKLLFLLIVICAPPFGRLISFLLEGDLPVLGPLYDFHDFFNIFPKFPDYPDTDDGIDTVVSSMQ